MNKRNKNILQELLHFGFNIFSTYKLLLLSFQHFVYEARQVCRIKNMTIS
jgi:choline-glycine betaine transporter